jgi:serine/threonine protein kinase
LEVIKKAYDVARECKFLPQVEREPKLLGSSYSIEIGPLGCSVRLHCEQDCKQFAQNVCQALAVLHRNGLVYRDVRLPNVVKVFDSQGEYYFMLIDLETIANADFVLPEGFDSFRFWTNRTLEGSRYIPRSDMYHLGEILRSAMWDFASPLAMKFCNELTAKELDAEMALRHP